MSSLTLPSQYYLPDPRAFIDLDLLRESEQKYATAALAANTTGSYCRRWQMFSDWCLRASRCAMPASSETIRWYIIWALEVRRNRLGTVKITLSSIANAHRKQGLASPIDGEIRKLVVNCTRFLKEPRNVREAITVEQVRAICVHICKAARPIGVRDRAILLLGFASGWRSDELTSLEPDDIAIEEKGIKVELRKSKTGQLAVGRLIGIQRGEDELTCPVRALEDWIAVRGNIPGKLFVAFARSGKTPGNRALTPHAISEIVKRYLERTGVDPTQYGAHSLRAGMITAAVENGASELAIMDRTGHKSVQMVHEYVRRSKAFRSNPLKGVL